MLKSKSESELRIRAKTLTFKGISICDNIDTRKCAETEYWIEILMGANCILEETTKILLQECGVISHMFVKSINTAKGNSDKK